MELNRRQFSLMCAAAPILGLQLPPKKKIKSYEEFINEDHHEYEISFNEKTHSLICKEIGLKDQEGHYIYYESKPCLVDIPKKHAFVALDRSLLWGEVSLIRFVSEFHYVKLSPGFLKLPHVLLCNDFLIPHLATKPYHLPSKCYFSKSLFSQGYRDSVNL